MTASRLDRLNRSAFSTWHALRYFRGAAGGLEAGAEAAIGLAAAEHPKPRILDIGIGGGRTVPLMLAIGRDYLGVDYLPQMVGICRKRFPDVAFETMDARALNLPDASRDLIAFSFNGIDAIDYEGRLRVLAEAHRVLSPGGMFVFSALNQDGPVRQQGFKLPRAREGRSLFLEIPRTVLKIVLNLAGYLRGRGLHGTQSGMSQHALPAHNYGVVAMYTSLPEQVRQLHDAAFDIVAVVAEDGRRLDPSRADAEARWYHVVAKKLQSI